MKHINKFDSINEELFGIDLKKIKAAALEYTSTKEYKSLLLSLDKSLFSSVTNEIYKIKNKWKSFDDLSKALVNKSQDINESFSGVILSIFGFHFIMKFLAKLKNDWTFKKFITRLYSSGKENDFSEIRDFVISITFVLWVIIYTIGTSAWTSDYYHLRGNAYVDLPSSWNGFNDYDVRDDSGKKYIFKRTDSGGEIKYIIEYKGKNIGYFKNDHCIYDIQGNKILTDLDVDTDKNMRVKFDLENALMVTPSKSKELDELDNEISRRNAEIKKLNNEINNITSNLGSSKKRQYPRFKKDSKKSKPSNLFDKKTFGDSKNEGVINENLAQAKRILREKGIDYDNKEELLNLQRINTRFNMGYSQCHQQELEDLGIIPKDTDPEELERLNLNLLIKNKMNKYNLLYRFERFKNRLQADNSIGYLGLLTKFIASGVSNDRVERAYAWIKRNRDIISNLRDSNFQRKDIFTFERFDDLIQSLEQLNEWRVINKIIRELPSQQKNIVWEDGWFKIEDRKKIGHIISCLREIENDRRKKEALLSKISSVRSFDDFYNILSRAARKEPWDFDFWTHKIESEKNAMITWSSKEQKQIICIVLSHRAIDELAYSTNWCIVRDPGTFARYKNEGYQCILFDFNYNSSDSKSIIGFTINTDGRVTYCYNKYDGPAYIPNKFLTQNGRKVDKKFIKISTKDILKNCEGNIIKYALAYIKIVLNKQYISKFIDMYDADE